MVARGLDIGGGELGICVLRLQGWVANQSETKSHISFCISAKRHIMYNT